MIAEKVIIAHSFVSRLIGLVGKKSLPEGSALVLKPCNSIHTCLMRTPIDVVFLDGQGTVVRLIPEMPPYKYSGIISGARKVAELPPGAISRNDVRIHDVLKLMGD
ncbi:MAG: DUF192 domain-containing protein [Bacillota bacterium]